MHCKIKIQRAQEVLEENKECVYLHNGRVKTFLPEPEGNLQERGRGSFYKSM